MSCVSTRQMSWLSTRHMSCISTLRYAQCSQPTQRKPQRGGRPKAASFVLALSKAHVLALNTAHVLRLNKADVLRLNKASFFGQVVFLGKIKECLACKQPNKEDKIKAKLTWEGSKWKSDVSWKVSRHIVKMQQKWWFGWKVHNKRIQLRSFS